MEKTFEIIHQDNDTLIVEVSNAQYTFHFDSEGKITISKQFNSIDLNCEVIPI